MTQSDACADWRRSFSLIGLGAPNSARAGRLETTLDSGDPRGGACASPEGVGRRRARRARPGVRRVAGCPALAPGLAARLQLGDSALLLDLHQYGGYNDNILNSPPGLKPTGSAVSQTAVGALGRMFIGPQRFFVDGRIGATDFLDDRSNSLHDHALHLGWDWRAGDACKGRLIATASDTQTETELASGPGLDTLRLRAIEQQDGRCALPSGFGLAFAAGALSLRHSLETASALDNDSVYGKLGLEEDRPDRDHAAIFAKVTQMRFTQDADGAPLPNSALTDVEADYRRIFSPWVQAEAGGGVSAAASAAGGPPPRAIGVYKAELDLTASDIWRIAFTASRKLGPPVSIEANSQVAEMEGVSVGWRPSPKLSVTASLNRLWLENGPTTPGLYGGTTLIMLSGKAVYQLTPFTSLTASCQRARRSLSSGNSYTDVAMIGVDFKPY